jgi:2-phospho-L-lactate guanylyltransferase
MLEDMLVVLREVKTLQRILVVTRPNSSCALFEALGVEVFLEEEGPSGENEAIEYATKACLQAGVQKMLVLHGDIPLLSGTEVETILELGSKTTPSVVLASSRDGVGTNALYRSPPDVIPPCFGVRSFFAHWTKAHERAIPVSIYHSPGLALDIDTPEDIALFCQYPGQTHTKAKLVEWGIPRQIRKRAWGQR